MLTSPILRTVLTGQAFLKELVTCIKPFSKLVCTRIHTTQKKNPWSCNTDENYVKISNTVLLRDIPTSHVLQGRDFLTLLWRARLKPQHRQPHILGRKLHNHPLLSLPQSSVVQEHLGSSATVWPSFSVRPWISLSFHFRFHSTKSFLWKIVRSSNKWRQSKKVLWGMKQKGGWWFSSVSTPAEERVLQFNRQGPGFNR